MYRVKAYGLEPGSKQGLLGVLKNLPEKCELSFEEDLVSEAGSGWQHPAASLLEADDGLYHIWLGEKTFDLLITPTKIVLDDVVVVERKAKHGLFVPDHVLHGFKSLLEHANRRIGVYTDLYNTAHQEYLIYGPDDTTLPIHPRMPNMRFAGYLNLKTGEVI